MVNTEIRPGIDFLDRVCLEIRMTRDDAIALSEVLGLGACHSLVSERAAELGEMIATHIETLLKKA